MGKKDITLKDYLSDSAKYADLWNGSMFQGRQVIKAEELSELNTVQSKSDRQAVLERSNDIAMKQTADGKCLAVWLVANQETVDYSMPVRVMLQEALEYDRQLKEIRRKNKEAYRKAYGGVSADTIKNVSDEMENSGQEQDAVFPTSGEFLSKVRRSDRLHPVVTLVVYWGEEEWQGAQSLHDMLDFGVGNDADSVEMAAMLKQYAADYPIHILNLSKPNDYQRFQTQLRPLFELYARRKQKEAFSAYLEEHGKELDEETYWVLGQLIHSRELQNYTPEEGKEREDMSNVITELIEDGRTEGKTEGKTEGLKALVRTLKRMLPDSGAVYEMIIQNEEYRDVSRQQVMEYYNN